MSNIYFSPIKITNKLLGNKITPRPFSSIQTRRSFLTSNLNNNNELLYPITDKRNIKYIVENNLYDSFSQNSTKITNTRNHFNKLRIKDLRGKDRYSNFTVFLKREMSQKENKIKPKELTKKLNRQHSAVQLNPNKIFREGALYLTDIIAKKPQKQISKNLKNYAPFHKRNGIDFTKKIYKNDNVKSDFESQVINNHKYKNIDLLRKIESARNLKQKSNDFEEEKNTYLFQKKLEYISINEKKTKALYNYMENLDNYIKNQYSNKLKAEKVRISNEEIKNENRYINDKITSIKNTHDLYNDLFLNKFNDYVKFLIKKVDQYDKGNYFLINEVFILQKQVDKLKTRINKLLEEKKMYNKFILLQINLKQKTSKLPEYYDFILNHTLEEGIEHYKGKLDENEVKEIFKYKKKIIYKNYETFNYQFKAYENENRDLLKKLGTMKREISKLNENKNELIEEGKQITNYFNNKIKEKSKEKINVMNKYHLLINEKNNLLTEIKFNFTNVNNIHKKPKKRNSFIQDYNTIFETTHRSSNNNTNATHHNKEYKATNTKRSTRSNKYGYPNSSKNLYSSTKDKPHLTLDEQIFLNFNIIYEPKEKNTPHSNLYLKTRQLFLLLKKYIKKDEFFKKEEKITTENGLIIKLLSKIEKGLNAFIENKRAFDEKNKEIISKMKQKIEKQRKIMKGQKYMSMLKEKYENMKHNVEEKANKIYFLPKNKKRNVSANINKKRKNKKLKKVVEKSEYELLIEYFKEN